jgi:hypothetical protein
MSDRKGEDRRRFPRVPAAFDVKLVPMQATARARDVSTGGVGVVCDEHFRRSIDNISRLATFFELDLALPGAHRERVLATVAWQAPDTSQQPPGARFGFEFVFVPPRTLAKLCNLVNERVPH